MFCVPTGIWAIICLITWYYLFFGKESDKNIKKRIENFGVKKYKELEKIANSNRTEYDLSEFKYLTLDDLKKYAGAKLKD